VELGIEKEEVRREREGTKELIETIAGRSERKEKEERRKKIEETRLQWIIQGGNNKKFTGIFEMKEEKKRYMFNSKI